ncbi:hypothetical protein AB2T96_00740 [Clostridium butyricum]|uniref:hypothetical protein n=1 Tax=Clostridium butyricum TaxID=1492 RepID=UPI001CAA3A42|nr:hypothetical protein [Clostridium butyricum]MBZ0311107.1 hypothetical protein [Clostridium butyricum]
MNCKECYSDNPRITPILKPQHCLENHLQYICSTCGRCICIDKDNKRNVYRWNFPFKTLEFAKLYLRTAEVSFKDTCGIYKITGKNNRISYKIFHRNEDLEKYLANNKDKLCNNMNPIYISKEYSESPNAQIRKLNKQEVNDYINEQKQYLIKLK